MTSSNIVGGRPGRLFFGGGTLTTTGNYLGDGTDIGPGTINGTVIEGPGGVIEPGGTTGVGILTINGSLILQAGASVEIGVGAQGFATLTVNGNASLAGLLTVSLLGGFVPDPDAPDEFQVITYTTYDGSFDNSTIDLGSGLQFLVDVGDAAVTLVTQRIT